MGMNFNPKDAPTEFLRKYGEFLVVVQKEEFGEAEKLLDELINVPEVSHAERTLLALGDLLTRGHMEFEEVFEEYSEQIQKALRETNG